MCAIGVEPFRRIQIFEADVLRVRVRVRLHVHVRVRVSARARVCACVRMCAVFMKVDYFARLL